MIQIAAKVAEYFSIEPSIADTTVTAERPVIIGAFGRSSRGWVSINGRPATVAAIRLLKGQGAQSIEVYFAGRSADFTCDEIIRYAERPLLGGSLI